VIIAASAFELARSIQNQWFLLAALTLISGSKTIKLPSVPATISISETFVFSSVILFGPAAGATIVALDGLLISVLLAKRRKEFYRIAFNMAAPALSIWIAATLYYSFPGVHALYGVPKENALALGAVIFPLLVFTVCHFLLNSWLIAFAISFETGRHPFEIWRTEFFWLSLNYLGGASVSALLSVYTRGVDYTYISIIIPLLLILYFTFKIPMARVEDANLHLKKVNSLYLSTIETLALAVDAKDQVTHGHIRRVQNYTVELAKALGIRDELMIKAIEASALLHDMGKLAIPEHILNKPGKLTAAEFEKMKLHATIGADILSAIEFPYPVVPIVRHHHENWDGTGYPAGLSGTDIPIGARILSVVDCFDALTSDRPYRPALSDEEATAILMQRRGNMYDPLVVDTFVRVRRELVSHPEPSALAASAAIAEAQERIAGPASEKPHPVGDALSAFLLYQILSDFADRSWHDAADLVMYRLSKVIPLAAAAVFAYDAASDSIVCESIYGAPLERLLGVKRPLGEGLSAWVAANRRSIMNSVPALDLADSCPEACSELSSTLSVPIVAREELIGVLTVYAQSEQAFNEHHRQVLEGVAPHVGRLVRRSRVFVSANDALLPHYPGASHLDHYLRRRLQGRDSSPVWLIVLELDEPFGRSDHALLEEVAAFASSNVRGGDLVFACGASTLVCLLADATESSTQSVRERLLSFSTQSDQRQSLWTFRSAVVSVPRDGETLAQLLAVASSRFSRSDCSLEETAS
jgi:putative nucleotidyltransferase with HDIG domain